MDKKDEEYIGKQKLPQNNNNWLAKFTPNPSFACQNEKIKFVINEESLLKK